MHAAGQFTGKCLVDHAVALDPALSAKRFRHNMNTEVRLPALPVSGMSRVLMRLILHVETLRRKRGGELFGYLSSDIHGT